MSGSPLLIAMLLLSGCALRIQERPLLSPEALNSNPDAYHERTVSVEGHVVLANAGHHIYQSMTLKEEFTRKLQELDSFDPRPYVPYCLTIANPQIFEGHEKSFSGQSLVFKGMFLKDYLNDRSMDLGACPLPTAIVIDESDARRRYPGLFGGSESRQ